MDNSQPLVSIITPCFNDGEWIEQTINSVLGSTYQNIEMVIVDDCSTDTRTKQVLAAITDNRIKVHYNETNQGVSATRNKAIRLSSGKYVLPVDGDDLISKDFITLGVEALENDTDIKIVATDFELFGRYKQKVKLEEFSIEKLLGHNIFTISSMFRRGDFDMCRGFNENMRLALEDWDFWLTMLESGGKVHYLRGTHFFYRIKAKKLSRNIASVKSHSELRRQIWNNHRELYARYFFDPEQSFEYIELKSTSLKQHILNYFKRKS